MIVLGFNNRDLDPNIEMQHQGKIFNLTSMTYLMHFSECKGSIKAEGEVTILIFERIYYLMQLYIWRPSAPLKWTTTIWFELLLRFINIRPNLRDSSTFLKQAQLFGYSFE
jgi:hypothetical protein